MIDFLLINLFHSEVNVCCDFALILKTPHIATVTLHCLLQDQAQVVVTDDHAQTAGNSADLDNTQNKDHTAIIRRYVVLDWILANKCLSCRVFENKSFFRNSFECRTQNHFGGKIC